MTDISKKYTWSKVPKSDIVSRLKASLRFGVIDGSHHEKSVFENQVREAIRYIEALEKERLFP